ncbi:MAG: nicotinate phosphoribosyltransferase [Rhodopirellula sp.]|nr:nicotinate phosphoribosyltransferase [Rhodopirellula sp.]
MSSPLPGPIAQLYRPSLALLTDLYQLTMAYGYWARAMHDREAVFHLIFRENPFRGGFTVACGLHAAIEHLERLRFDSDDLAYLASLAGHDGSPLFSDPFLDFLGGVSLTCDVDAVAEGTVVFPHEPLVRVRGPLLEAQILETALLNLINFPTLIATKAARVALAARGEAVLEFGLRRAQGIDGAVSASRAAYVGGCAGTSNVLAGRLFGIPVKGTHAHSWVMCFETELEAFEAYAGAMPNNCVFLVDTYNTLEGVRNAVTVGRRLRERGYRLLGIRLDSGDLAYLSIEARKILDAEGFADAAILASSDLDEHIITSLKEQGATIAVWGVGTRLATAYDQPALGGVYKLSAIRNREGEWEDRVKLSEQAVKTSTPGILQVRRFRQRGRVVGDLIFDQRRPLPIGCVAVDPSDPTRRKSIPRDAQGEDLLVPVFRKGRCVYSIPPLEDCRRRAAEQLAEFHAGVKRFVHPHQYPAGLEAGLHQHKTEMILRTRGNQA